ncbi:MarR family winged helix-turn-helix transcriptional regulator [Bifidobacterium bombi]|uniref:Transcriptional regulator, MarR family n=1 Tax=Bifidobacterium bombi DSM 19703 TaxID=1341695 RepID=A0A080N606_9BIFI|nr:MarR family winged helix-turn-helix transcriptional regulator [Bifidobacterium bombi]KFF31169.1 transcriptional regulator, MarR family [Bifidobacterium bombi DSM 19703]
MSNVNAEGETMQWLQGAMSVGDSVEPAMTAVRNAVEDGQDDGNLASLIKVANTLIERELNNRVAELLPGLSLTGPQITLLVYLYDSKGRTVTQKEVADRFVLSHPTMHGIVSRLERAKLVDLSHLNNDRRQVVLSLSEHGFETIDRHIDEIRAILNDINTRIVSGIGEGESEHFVSALSRIIRSF